MNTKKRKEKEEEENKNKKKVAIEKSRAPPFTRLRGRGHGVTRDTSFISGVLFSHFRALFYSVTAFKFSGAFKRGETRKKIVKTL